jgi:hypothetical protein
MYALVDQGVYDHHVWLAYSHAWPGTCSLVGDGDCSTEDLGAQYFTVGYLYRLSDAADVYAVYYRLMNDRSASYTTFPPAPPIPAAGADAQSFGIGTLYRFNVSLAKSP